MKSFLELISLLSMLVTFGGLIYAGYLIIVSDPRIGLGTTAAGWEALRMPLTIAGLAIATNVVAGRLQKWL